MFELLFTRRTGMMKKAEIQHVKNTENIVHMSKYICRAVLAYKKICLSIKMQHTVCRMIMMRFAHLFRESSFAFRERAFAFIVVVVFIF